MAGNMVKITDYDQVIPMKNDVLLINQNGSNRKTTVNDLVGDIGLLDKKLAEKVNENTTQLNAITNDTGWITVTTLLNGFTGTIRYRVYGNLLKINLRSVTNTAKVTTPIFIFPDEYKCAIQDGGVIRTSTGELAWASYENGNLFLLTGTGDWISANTIISGSLIFLIGGKTNE